MAPGQILRIPVVDGIIHTVQPHETVGEIADLYGVDAAAIAAFRPNNLRALQPCEGREVLVPGGLR